MNSRSSSRSKPSQKAANIDVHVAARPEAVDLPLARTALVVVDMQNGYGSPGGYRELIGRSMSGAERVVDNTVRVIAAARAAGVTVVYLQNGWDADLKTSGGPDSPNWHKSNPLKLMRERPELSGKILTHGSWDYDFVPRSTRGPRTWSCRRRATAAFAGPSSTTCCARATSAI